MSEDKYSLYAAWINTNDPVCIWSYQPDWNNMADDAKRIINNAISLATDMLGEFYKETDTNVFGLIDTTDTYDFRSEVRIIGEDNAFFMSRYRSYDLQEDAIFYKKFGNWFKVYTMKEENIPKVLSLLEDWKMIFLAIEDFDKFDEIASEIPIDKMIDFLKKYTDKIPDTAKERILEKFPEAYAGAEYAGMYEGDR